MWANLPIYTIPNAPFRDAVENQNPLTATEAFKPGLFYCESESCSGRNIISPRSFDRVCVFCGMTNNLSPGLEFGFRPNRSDFTQIYPTEFNPFMNFLRNWFASEPHLSEVGIELGIRKYQAGMRVRYSILVKKSPVYEIRKGFEFGVLNGGLDNRFSIPTQSEREGAREEGSLGFYNRLFVSKDPKPITPSFEDKSFLLGPETEYPTSFPVSVWPSTN